MHVTDRAAKGRRKRPKHWNINLFWPILSGIPVDNLAHS
jgi:hypothetical protein